MASGGLGNSLVIVDVQLRSGVRSPGSLERNADEVLSEDVIEDGGSETALLIEHLVDDVPVEDLSLPAAHEVVDVLLNDSGQGRLVADLADPSWKLRVPDKSVGTDCLVVLGGELHEGIGAVQVVAAAGTLGLIPLHAVAC